MRALCTSILIFALSGLFFSAPAYPCGESMFRIGKGVHFRAYSAPIPGTVLVFARTAQEREVAEGIQQAGHQVLIVETDFELSKELHERDFDVIVAPASKRDSIEMQATNLPSPPRWIPVYSNDSAQEQSLKPLYGKGVASDDDLRKYLKAIHKSLKSTGSP